MSNGQSHASEYNYSHFTPDLMTERFEGGPKPGEVASDFTAPTLQGDQIRLSEFRGNRHVVLQFGSVT
jgi:hypothetical protein